MYTFIRYHVNQCSNFLYIWRDLPCNYKSHFPLQTENELIFNTERKKKQRIFFCIYREKKNLIRKKERGFFQKQTYSIFSWSGKAENSLQSFSVVQNYELVLIRERKSNLCFLFPSGQTQLFSWTEKEGGNNRNRTSISSFLTFPHNEWERRMRSFCVHRLP